MNSIWEDLKYSYRTDGTTQRLIYWNVGVFVVAQLVLLIFPVWGNQCLNWMALPLDFRAWLFQPWGLITYTFFHATFMHLLFNMLVLHFAGRLFETYFNGKQTLGVYLLSGVGAGFLCMLGSSLFGINGSIMVGASASIMGLLTAVTTYNPLMPVRLMLIGQVRLWHITGCLLFLDLIQWKTDVGGHVAHLCGAVFGIIYMLLLQKGTDLSRLIPGSNSWYASWFSKSKTPLKRVHVNRAVPPTNANLRKVVQKTKEQQQVDEILDKISKSGYDSLSQAEKEFLFRAGKS
jgi:membrane associated rhomboid family serine protease